MLFETHHLAITILAALPQVLIKTEFSKKKKLSSLEYTMAP